MYFLEDFIFLETGLQAKGDWTDISTQHTPRPAESVFLAQVTT